MRTIVGQIVAITGVAEIVNSQGQHVLLKAGDTLHEGDQLLTANGAMVEMRVPHGEVIQFPEQQLIQMSDIFSGQSRYDVSEQAVHPAVIQHVLATLMSDELPLELSAPLASVLQHDDSGFISTAYTSLTDSFSTPHNNDVLNIQDVLVTGEYESVVQSSSVASNGVPVSQVADLVTQTTGVGEFGLPDAMLKEFLKD